MSDKKLKEMCERLAVSFYRMDAEEGDASAMYNLAVCYYNGEGVEQDYEQAIKWFQQAADAGNGKAMFSLGVCYEYGRGVP